MEHIVSIWAHWYALPDPVIPANDILGMRPDELLADFDRAARAAHRLSLADEDVARAQAAIGRAWSNPLPWVRIGELHGAGESGRPVIDAQVVAAHRAAEAIPRCASGVRAAFSAADAAIHQPGPLALALVSPVPDEFLPSPLQPVVRLVRTRIVTTLNWQLSLLHRAAATAVDDLGAALATDPRAFARAARQVPVGLPPPAPGPAVGVDAANRDRLAADLTATDPARRRFANGVRAGLAAAGAKTAALLLVYDPDHPARQGAAAISVGDVATADHVAVLVPGVGNTPTDLTGLLGTASELRRDAGAAAPGERTAAVVWVGYDVPLSDLGHGTDRSQVMRDAAIALSAVGTRAGGRALADYLPELRKGMSPGADLTLIGHSYGSTVVSEAAHQSIPIDTMVLLGSPGAGWDASSARDYPSVPADRVYVLGFPQDPVVGPGTDLLASALQPLAPHSGAPFGPDPANPAFGAEVIDAPSNLPDVQISIGGLAGLLVDPISGDLKQHELRNYLTGASGAAVAGVVVGRFSTVPTRRKPKR